MPTSTATGEFRASWRVLATTTVGAALGSSGAWYYTTGIFYRPVGAAFGVAPSLVPLASLVGTVLALLIAVPFGRIVDRFKPRRVALVSVPVFSLTILSLALYHGPYAGFFVLWALVVALGTGAGPTTYTRIVNGRFDRARGRAVGLTLAGLGLAGFLLPTPLAWIISHGGYRAGYLALGLLTLLVWPLIYFLPRDHGISSRANTGAVVSPGWAARRAFRSPVYIATTAIFAIACMAVTAVFVQLSPIMQSRGLGAVQAASIVSLAGLGVIAGRVGIGVLMDRFFPTRIAIWLFCVTAAGVALLWLPSIAAASVAAALLGVALGAEGDMVAYLTARYFGLRSYASLYAFSYSCFAVGAALGPYLTGALHDTTGTFTTAIGVSLVVLLICALAVAFLPRRSLVDETVPVVSETGTRR